MMSRSAQSGSIWSNLLCPQSASLNQSKLGQVRLGHFLCVL